MDSLWVVSFPHHARGEALDKVNRRSSSEVAASVVRPFCFSAVCRSAVLSFGRSVVPGRSVVRPFRRSAVHVARHRKLSTSRVSLFAVVFLTQDQGLVNSLWFNCTLRPSSSFIVFMSYGVASRSFQEFRISVTSQRDL